MVAKKLTDDEIEGLQNKCYESEWSLRDDSALCHILEGCRDYYTHHVEKLEGELAKINQLAALLNSGVGHLNGSIIHAANSRFLQQHLAEDATSRFPPTEEVVNNPGDGRADTIATLSVAIRQGISATNHAQNITDLCSNRPIIGSQSFKDSLLSHKPTTEKPVSERLANPSSSTSEPLPSRYRKASTSASEESSEQRPHSFEQPTLEPPSLNPSSEIPPPPIIPAKISPILRPPIYVPVPKAESSSSSEITVDTNVKPVEDISRPIEKVSDIRRVIHKKDDTSDIRGVIPKKDDHVTNAPLPGKAFGAPVVNANITPKTEANKKAEDKSDSSTSSLGKRESPVEQKRSEVKAQPVAEEKFKEKDHQESKVADIGGKPASHGITAQSITKKYASIFDSDSDDDALFLDPRKSLPTTIAKKDEETMKKIQAPKKLETTDFAKKLAEKLTKGPTLAAPTPVAKSVTKPPEVKSSQKGDPDVPPTWPLPSVSKTRARGPTRRPPSRSKPSTTDAGAKVPEKASVTASVAVPSNSRTEVPVKKETDKVPSVERKVESTASTKPADQISEPPKPREDVTTKSSAAPRPNIPKAARSFFDSESDEENEPIITNQRVESKTSVTSAASKGDSSVRAKPASDSSPKVSASSKGALPQKTPKSQFAKGLFDDDEEDDDLSMFRKPKGS
uniref:CAP-Gly domain-containing protein n=1 Tax=Haemonchus contortus TaxID=6289 RepID=A0A7I4Z482_HAECO|nr:neurofilament heavy polypeptide [Haemonchus contortus]